MRNWPASESRFTVEPSWSGLLTGPPQPEAPTSAAKRVARSSPEPDIFLSHSTSPRLKRPIDAPASSIYQKISSAHILANVFLQSYTVFCSFEICCIVTRLDRLHIENRINQHPYWQSWPAEFRMQRRFRRTKAASCRLREAARARQSGNVCHQIA